MDLNEVMRTTFAARQYTGEPLPDEVLYEILEHAQLRAERRQPAGQPGHRGA